MTVAVQDDALLEWWRHVTRSMLSQEFREQKRLLGETSCVAIIRKQVDELIAKDGQAARLEHDDRYLRVKVRSQYEERLAQQPLGLREKTVVIQRATAADRRCRQHDVVTRCFKDLRRGNGGVGMEVIV